MNTLKEKVTEKLSRIFAESPSSVLSSTSTDSDPNPPKVTWYPNGRKSLSSFFSNMSPSLPLAWRNKDLEHDSEHWENCEEFRSRYESVPDVWEEEEHNSIRGTSGSEMFEDANSPNLETPLPKIVVENSKFVSSELYDFLHSSLPNIVKGCQWVLLYSTLKHGISLRTLIRKSGEIPGHCLLIAGDMQGAVFGGLLDSPLKPTAKRKYQGSNQTFVFTTLYGEPRLFRPTGANRYFCLCLNDMLALGGGGHFALCLNEDLLSGTSGPCETFGNLCLASKSEYELKNVELWGFTHSSKNVG